jgi:hypothetical protein
MTIGQIVTSLGTRYDKMTVLGVQFEARIDARKTGVDVSANGFQIKGLKITSSRASALTEAEALDLLKNLIERAITTKKATNCDFGWVILDMEL